MPSAGKGQIDPVGNWRGMAIYTYSYPSTVPTLGTVTVPTLGTDLKKAPKKKKRPGRCL
jgi:hypothetical protein